MVATAERIRVGQEGDKVSGVSAEANGGRWRWAGNGVDAGWRVDFFSLDKPWPRIFESRPDLRSKKYTPLNPLRDPLGQI
jgi:hypothetical protein